jgi:hypothetical protein
MPLPYWSPSTNLLVLLAAYHYAARIYEAGTAKAFVHEFLDDADRWLESARDDLKHKESHYREQVIADVLATVPEPVSDSVALQLCAWMDLDSEWRQSRYFDTATVRDYFAQRTPFTPVSKGPE